MVNEVSFLTEDIKYKLKIHSFEVVSIYLLVQMFNHNLKKNKGVLNIYNGV